MSLKCKGNAGQRKAEQSRGWAANLIDQQRLRVGQRGEEPTGNGVAWRSLDMHSRDGKGSELIAIHSKGNAWSGVAWRSVAKAKQLNTFD